MELSGTMQAAFERILEEDGVVPDATLLPPAEGRAATELANRRWNRVLPAMAAEEICTKPADASLNSPQIPVQVLVPASARPGVVVFVHGGGFAFCSPATHARFARMLAVESGLTVIVPEYRLAPEHPFPAGLMDTISTFRHAHALASRVSGMSEGPVFLAGDSAGANLALATMLHEQQQQRVAGDGGVLFYGVYDADFATESYQFFANGPGLTLGKMQRFWDWYLADAAARRQALASPLHADDEALLRLPPLHLAAAGVDPLLSDSINLAHRLAGLGRSEKLEIVPGVTHSFLQMSEDLPEARAALKQAGSFLRSRS
ncbi:alpha/beta hydrolase [Aureimonas fodinaquatilis]|uniref:Alpha/beta hydrolase n=2 Tax=Aureimonas fodinaquatilis TaxID=2565783 RepID=A0A5B0DRK0_9HYPH|nr:alpha/beta hydrolase [Aureimonas fodinaquatilis]